MRIFLSICLMFITLNVLAFPSDDQQPTINSVTPQDGATIYPTSTMEINVSDNVIVKSLSVTHIIAGTNGDTINLVDRPARNISASFYFADQFEIKQGQNLFIVQACDKAGNCFSKNFTYYANTSFKMRLNAGMSIPYSI